MLSTTFSRSQWTAGLVFAALTAAVPCSAIPIVIYEHLPESANTAFQSRHGVGGPILADDFDPAPFPNGSYIGRVEWWGTAANDSRFEITFHLGQIGGGGFGEPRAIPPDEGGYKFEVVPMAALDSGITGLYHYIADIGPVDITGRVFPLQQGPRPFGTEFWFSVANFAPGWTWALAGAGPTVGDEHWSGVRSLGSTPCGDGGPHCGAWDEISGRDFAFRLTAVPEPGTLALSAAGLALIAFGRRRRCLP